MKKAITLSMLLVCGLVLPAALAEGGAGLPDGFKGFRGLLKGTISSKTENSFVLKVASVENTFPKNTAKKPEEIVGKEITILVKQERLLGALKEREVGQTVIAGAAEEGKDGILAIEQIRRAEAAATTPPPAGTDETARLRARITELEKAVAALKAENEALRKQLAEAKGTAPK